MIGLSLPALEKMPYSPTMPKNRSIPFAVLVLVLPWIVSAQAPPSPPPGPSPPAEATTVPSPTVPAGAAPAAPAPPAPPTEAEKIIDEAIKKIEAISAVSADIVQKLEMLGQQFELRGKYLKANQNRFSIQLSVAGLDATNGTMFQICDGTTLWDFHQVLESQSCRRLQIGPILAKLNSKDFPPELRTQIIEQFGLAGPTALLTGLRRAVHFDQKEADKVDGKPVWVLRGSWISRTGLIGPDRQPLPPTGPLPPYIPNIVSVWIGQDDGWPYEVDLAGQAPTILYDSRPRDSFSQQPIGPPSPPAPVQITRIKLFYQNVNLNPSISSKDFAFQVPPNVEVQDDTQTFESALDQALKAREAQQKAEAARKEQPLLPQSIDIPKPEGASPSTESPGKPSPNTEAPRSLTPPATPSPK
jgi:outer membrane lipoprotein-sorting protein